MAFLDYNSVLPEEWEAREDKPGCAPIKIATYYEQQEFEPGTPPMVITIPREEHVVAMEKDIRRAKEQADVVVVSFHWGIHFIAGALADYQFTVGPGRLTPEQISFWARIRISSRESRFIWARLSFTVWAISLKRCRIT